MKIKLSLGIVSSLIVVAVCGLLLFYKNKKKGAK